MRLVMWPCENARIIVCPVRLPIIRVQVSYNAHLVSIFCCTCNPKIYACYVLTLAICTMLNAFVNWTLVGSCLLACIIHIPFGLTLIITVIGFSQLGISHLGKCYLVCTVALLVYIVSASCAYCCLFNIPNVISRRQLIGNCMTTCLHLPKFKWRTSTCRKHGGE